MSVLKKYNLNWDDITLFLILIIAATLRLYRFWDIPFMHDEFSAIIRSQFDNFSDLIKFGVYPDSHPAGVQIYIYYWIKLFGLNEGTLKLPFILSGIFSVYLVYKLAKLWFGKEAALFSTLIVAITQFTIFYSQLARPYSPGLMFVLISSIYWTKLIFHKEYNKKNIILYLIGASLASYTHAFSLFFIVVQGITGLFFLKGKEYKWYILINTILIVLYIPHLQIFYEQLKRGDIGGWLTSPKPTFFVDFITYSFHYSQIFYFIIPVAIFFLSTSSIKRIKGTSKFRIIALVFVLTTYLTAYFYSVYRIPIIQFSTLLFIFPYFIMLLFSYVGKLKPQIKYGFLTGIGIIGIFSLVYTRQHYNLMYEQAFDGIAHNVNLDLNNYKSVKTKTALQAPNYNMFNYYFEKNNLDTSYFKIQKGKFGNSMSEFLIKEKPKILLYGWADYESLNNLTLLKDNFKYILKRKNFFNSEYFVFSDTLIGNDFDKDINQSIKITSTKNQKIYYSSEPGFSKSIKINTDTLQLTKFSVFNLAARINYSEPSTDALLVMDLQDKDGKSIWWTASELSAYYLKNSDKTTVYHSRRIINNYPFSKACILKAYIWKRDKGLLDVESLEFYISHISPMEFGLYNKLN